VLSQMCRAGAADTRKDAHCQKGNRIWPGCCVADNSALP
jgi:hypothetical protein